MECDVAIIGAGPAGAAIASLLVRDNFKTVVLEKSYFPRFSIGESLLPQSMQLLDQCGLLEHIPPDIFQVKEGALFQKGSSKAHIDFSFKFSEGPETTWQVMREEFDTILINAAASSGAEVVYGADVTDIIFQKNSVKIQAGERVINCKFVIDASGSAMVLPKLMGTVEPPQKDKASLFAHFTNDSRTSLESRNILISVNQQKPELWYWGIPLPNNRISVGVTGDEEIFSNADSNELLSLVSKEPAISRRLAKAELASPCGFIKGYRRAVSKVHGERFLIIGNAGGFMDPIFSSGLTVAFKTAIEGFKCVRSYLEGYCPDWSTYDKELDTGNKAFKACIDSWYDGTLQDIIFNDRKAPDIQKKINSILAGYAWDSKNSFVRDTKRKLKQLHNLIVRESL